MEIAHYAARNGMLYEDVNAWRRAHNLVAAFVRPRRGNQAVNWWKLDRYISFDLSPGELLDNVHSAITSEGFEVRDRNDNAFSSTYSLVDDCRVCDLPEPYGKWLQSQGRPRWSDNVTLTLIARFQTEARSLRGRGPGSTAHLHVSAPAPKLPVVLRERLRQLQHLQANPSGPGQARMDRLVESAFRAAVGR